MARGVVEQLSEHAQELGCADELESLLEVVDRGTGARRQLTWLEGHDGSVEGLMREIVDATEP